MQHTAPNDVIILRFVGLDPADHSISWDKASSVMAALSLTLAAGFSAFSNLPPDKQGFPESTFEQPEIRLVAAPRRGSYDLPFIIAFVLREPEQTIAYAVIAKFLADLLFSGYGLIAKATGQRRPHDASDADEALAYEAVDQAIFPGQVVANLIQAAMDTECERVELLWRGDVIQLKLSNRTRPGLIGSHHRSSQVIEGEQELQVKRSVGPAIKVAYAGASYPAFLAQIEMTPDSRPRTACVIWSRADIPLPDEGVAITIKGHFIQPAELYPEEPVPSAFDAAQSAFLMSNFRPSWI